MTITTIIKKVIFRDRNFTIVKDSEGFYSAIEDKYITNGKTNTALNGLQMHSNRELSGCLESTKNAVETDYYISQGFSKAEAFCKVFDMMDRLEDVEKLFNH